MNQRQSKSRVRQAGYSRTSPKSIPRSEYGILQGGSPVSEAPEGMYSNPTMVHTLTTLLGYVVEVQLQSGLVYKGVLRAVSPQMDMALEVAHVKTTSPPSREDVIKAIELKFSDIMSISAKESSNPSFSGKEIFKTDAEISRTNGSSAGKELQPFTDFDDAAAVDLGDGEQHVGGWSVNEMWSVNTEKFKVQSSYDEEMTQYTTQLLRADTEDYKQRESRAKKLAAEIENQPKNPNRYGVDDAGTEEELFSAVVRPPVVTAVSRPGDDVSGATGAPLSSAVITSGQGVEPMSTSEQEGVDPTTTASQSEESTPSQTAGSPTEAIPGSASSSSDKKTELPVRPTEEGEPGAGKVLGDQPLAEEDTTAAAVPGDGQAGGGEEMVEGAEQVASDAPSEPVMENGGKKEKAIKAFKLDPNAKEFNPVAFMPATATATTTVARTAASPSPTQSSSVRNSSSTIYHPQGGQRPRYSSHKSPRQRTHQPTLIQEPVLLTTPTSSAYVVSAGGQPTVSAGLIRHLQQVPGQAIHSGIPHYASVQAGGGFIGQTVMAPQVVAGNPKLMEIPHPQVIGPMSTSLPQQIISQPGGQPLLPVASQQQLIQTPQGIFTAPHQPLLYMHGGAGGIPMQPIQPPFMPGQMSGALLPQNRVMYHPSGK